MQHPGQFRAGKPAPFVLLFDGDMQPVFTDRREEGHDIPAMFWRPDRPWLAIASGPLGGGVGLRRWVLNATVPMSYRRDDPDAHLAELATHFGLSGPGVGLLTGVDVADVQTSQHGGVTVWATVGLGAPMWAAQPADPPRRPGGRPPAMPGAADAAGVPDAPGHPVGTVNVVVSVPVRLSPAALVNAVATVTEAKAQALRELDIPGTGTATDAVCVLCPPVGRAEAYGGPMSEWGARIARAAHRAIRSGARAGGGRTGTMPWSAKLAGRV